MARRPAFTILELLIAMTLSSFIIFGVMQLYQGLVRYVENARSMMSLDRQTCLFFNQLERDLSTAYVPFLAAEIKAEKDGQQAQETPEEKKKREQQEREERKKSFVAAIDDRAAEIVRIGRQKVELFKYLSFICSNPLHVYGEKRKRLVRVIYELVVNKAKSTRDVPVYQLMRRETDELKNILAKADEYAAADKKKTVRSYVLLDNVKGLYIEYFGEWEEKKDKQQQPSATPVNQGKPKKKKIQSFRWGHVEQTQGVVPEKALVWLDLMNESKSRTYRFQALFPVFSFPTEDEEKRKQEEKEAQQQQQAPQGQPGQQGPPVPPAQPAGAPSGGMGSL